MARPSDVQDPELRARLVEAEQALDEGDYLRCVRGAVDVYSRLIEQRPDVFVDPTDRRGTLPTLAQIRVVPAQRPWPQLLGVVVDFDADGKPRLRFERERFTMTEAMTYFEYTLDAVVRAQRG
jgi:hypothetical protein